MDFFQEPTFTAFLAIILTFIVVKIVSFAVSKSNTDDDDERAVVCSVNEGPVAKKDVILSKGLRVKRGKDKKKVKFVDDVEIRCIDRYEGSDNLELVDEKSVDEKSWVDEDLGEKLVEDDEPQEKGCEKVEMVIEKESDDDDHMDRVFGEKQENLMSSGLKSEIFDEEKNEVKLEDGDAKNDQKEGSGLVGYEENKGKLRIESADDEEKNEVKLEDGDVKNDQKEENGLLGCEENEGKVRILSVDDDNDDDWEGIERSELEKVFAEAVNYLEYGGKVKDKEHDDKLAKMGSDVQMELYGLHKVAVEGPCHEPQPMALNFSARAKWNAWQKLGSMTQEAAMEQYIRVLSDSVPDWMHDYSADNDIQGSPKLETIGEISDPMFVRKLEHVAIPIGDSSEGQSAVEQGDTV